jgi:hypothetical protein
MWSASASRLEGKEGEGVMQGSLSPGSTKAMHASFPAPIRSGQFMQESITPELEAEFYDVLDACLSQIPRIFLRTNDALHLAAA